MYMFCWAKCATISFMPTNIGDFVFILGRIWSNEFRYDCRSIKEELIKIRHGTFRHSVSLSHCTFDNWHRNIAANFTQNNFQEQFFSWDKVFFSYFNILVFKKRDGGFIFIEFLFVLVSCQSEEVRKGDTHLVRTLVGEHQQSGTRGYQEE